MLNRNSSIGFLLILIFANGNQLFCNDAIDNSNDTIIIYSVKNSKNNTKPQVNNESFSIADLNLMDIFPADSVILYNLISNEALEVGSRLEKNDTYGYPAPWPIIISHNNNDSLNNAQELYENAEYNDCYNIIKEIFVAEKDNPFYLYIAAMLFYKNVNYHGVCYDMFNKLNSLAHDPNVGEEEHTQINAWFPEMYWKLGCIYLDRAEWLRAAHNITKFLVLFGQSLDNPVVEQAYGYLAEAYFYLDDTEQFDILYNFMIMQYPDNEYVLQFEN